LQQEKVKATFFVVGQQLNWAPNRDILKRALREGHLIASHTFNHPDLTTLSDSGIRKQMKDAEAAIASVIGKRPAYMRPPFIAHNDRVLNVLHDMGYLAVSCNVDSSDWNNPAPHGNSQVVKNIKAGIEQGHNAVISISHDFHQVTVDTLPTLLRMVKQAGYQLVRLDECLTRGHPPYFEDPSSPSPLSEECSETIHCPALHFCNKHHTYFSSNPCLYSCQWLIFKT
jgi:peptidoglycan/xylan/chitin deacetylase (PgdA/CDA1 family)